MSPKLPLLLRDLPLPLTHGFFCSHPSPYSKRHLNSLSATGLTVVTNRQTDRHTDRPRNVGNNSPHLMLCTAMRAKKSCDWRHLTETVQSVSASRPRSGLRSSSTSSMDYSLLRLRTKFGERAFSHAGPATWNALPDHIRTVVDPVKFRKLLKSHYFSQSFNIC